MNDKPTVDEISHLIETSNMKLAIERLDELLSYHAQRGEINVLVPILEEISLRYPSVEAIRSRLEISYRKLGRTGSDAETMFEA